MNIRLQLSTDAEKDLIDIWTYTNEKWGDAQADRYLGSLGQALEQLKQMPKMGKCCAAIDTGLFMYPCQQHIIFCFYEGQEMVIIAVLHKKMEALKRLEGRLDEIFRS